MLPVSLTLSQSSSKYLLIRVPAYGLCDSGRGFWKKVDHDAKDVGKSASHIFPAFDYHRSNGRVDLVLTTHVDDFLWARTDSGQVVMAKLLGRFAIGKREIGRLSFCGKLFSPEGKVSTSTRVERHQSQSPAERNDSCVPL